MKIHYVIFLLVYLLFGSISAKCINHMHNKIRIFSGEETKEYKCYVMQRVDAAFNENKECTYCGCQRDFHDNYERGSQEQES